MGLHATIAVWEATEEVGSGLILMLALADNADDDGLCYPRSVMDLAHKGRLSKRGAQLALSNLVKRRRIKQARSPFYDPQQKKTLPSVYQIVEPAVVAYLAELKVRREERARERQGGGVNRVHRGGEQSAPGGRTEFTGGVKPVHRGGERSAPALLIDPPISSKIQGEGAAPPPGKPNGRPTEKPDAKPATVKDEGAWSAVLAKVEDSALRQIRTIWLKGARLVGREGATFLVEVPNRFHADWLSENIAFIETAAKAAKVRGKFKFFSRAEPEPESEPTSKGKSLREQGTAAAAIEQLMLWHRDGEVEQLPGRTNRAIWSCGGLKRFRWAADQRPQELGFWLREFRVAYDQIATDRVA